jgi:outer membrane receptor protein involved in Fe transport
MVRNPLGLLGHSHNRDGRPTKESEIMLHRVFLISLFALFSSATLHATVFGSVRGIVHDPQHRPVPDIEVALKSTTSEYTQSTRSDANGEFHFDAVPLGEYALTVSKEGFASITQTVSVLSGVAPVLHFELSVAAQNQTITVSAPPAQTESITPTTLVDRLEIQETPGATRTNSLAVITNYVPGAYIVHDQLHVRGGHQVSWLIDGVPIPNTNIASNLGPQIDPKDMDTLEIQRGSYSADYGDRTYGIFNVAPRTGFERNNEGELVLSFGNFFQTDSQLNFGGHNNRFAYYASLSGNRTNLGLQTPTSAVVHDAANGFGGFTSLIYNLDSKNQLRFIAQVRRDFFQVPFDPNDPLTPGQYLRDSNLENDSFAAFSWVRTISPGLLLTVSPFFHHNAANYVSSPLDLPSSALSNRSSNYEGGQATIAWVQGRNNLRAGLYAFAQQDRELFALTYNCPNPPTPSCPETSADNIPLTRTNPNGALIAIYAEDQLKATSWLTLNAGFRQTHFSGNVSEDAPSPRVGVSAKIPKLNWVFRAFYGTFYQAPPLTTVSGSLLQNPAFTFIPLHGERNEEHQFGVTIPFYGWTIDADNFLTRAQNFFDHSNLNDSDLFFPVTIQGARINGWELTLRSPHIRKRVQLYLTYSNQLALGFGCISGGLLPPCPAPPPGYFLLDHDQRNTLHIGGEFTLPWQAYASTDVYYASGFTNGSAGPGDPEHLQPHTTFDLSLGKNFGDRFSVNLQGINVANRRVLLDNSFTFGGTHYNNPREIFVQVRYRFHY